MGLLLVEVKRLSFTCSYYAVILVLDYNIDGCKENAIQDEMLDTYSFTSSIISGFRNRGIIN